MQSQGLFLQDSFKLLAVQLFPFQEDFDKVSQPGKMLTEYLAGCMMPLVQNTLHFVIDHRSHRWTANIARV